MNKNKKLISYNIFLQILNIDNSTTVVYTFLHENTY